MSSLSFGLVPDCFKTAVVQSLLKKPTLDPDILNNFWPISKLPFLAKVLEKIVAEQIISFMNSNGLFEKFQQRFRAGYSKKNCTP